MIVLLILAGILIYLAIGYVILILLGIFDKQGEYLSKNRDSVEIGLIVTLWPMIPIMLICESIWKGICNFGNLLLDITRKRRK